MKVGEKNSLEMSSLQQGSTRAVKKSEAAAVQDAPTTEPGETTLMQGRIKQYSEEIKTANSALAQLGVASGTLGSMNEDGMEEAMESLRNIATSLKDILSKNLKAINNGQIEPRTYSSEEIRSNVAKPALAQAHNYAYLAERVSSLLA